MIIYADLFPGKIPQLRLGSTSCELSLRRTPHGPRTLSGLIGPRPDYLQVGTEYSGVGATGFEPVTSAV